MQCMHVFLRGVTIADDPLRGVGWWRRWWCRCARRAAIAIVTYALLLLLSLTLMLTLTFTFTVTTVDTLTFGFGFVFGFALVAIIMGTLALTIATTPTRDVGYETLYAVSDTGE
jgi:hypothetical protein